MSHRHREERLQRKLARLSTALGQQQPLPEAWQLRRERRRRRHPAATLLLVSLGLALGALVTHHAALFTPAAILLLVAGALALPGWRDSVLASLPAGLAEPDPTRARIGQGATIADDAVIEPGATVEMGATVGSGAVIRSGAVVRMGATVQGRAVIESGALIGWGATVQAGARVGAEAIVGAGATVQPDAAVPANTRLLPGATWTRGTGAPAPAAPPPPAPVPRSADPREARIAAACARIEAELAQASPAIREHLGGSAQAASSLRATCDELLTRERALRAESSPEALAFLEQEQAELERRAAAAGDERVRASLESAVAAIADQHRQRTLLRASAERIDAEITRLSWTLDGLAAQLVRLRTAGDAVGPTPGAPMLEAVQQLHDEIDAISDALEEVGAPAAEPGPVRAPERGRVR